jgi:hypothetical protein
VALSPDARNGVLTEIKKRNRLANKLNESRFMPYMPIFAKMPNGELRLVWADADAEAALKLGGGVKYYKVEIKTEEEFQRLRRDFGREKRGRMEAN